MKRCDKKEKKDNFPKVSTGDTLKRVTGLYAGDIYIVTYNRRLQNLDTTGAWNEKSLWGNSRPADWEKVNCCFSVEDDE